MILQSKSRVGASLVAGLLLATGPVWSQEEAGEDEGRPTHRLNIDLEKWIAIPSGLEYSPAVQADPTVSVANQQLNTKFGTEAADRYGIGFGLPGDNGRVVGGFQSLGFDTNQTVLTPGSYIYSQSLSFPLYAGVNDDGMADGFQYNTSTTLREWYIGYEKRAFRTQRVTGRWTLGWRRSTHRRNQDVNYYSVLSPLPPLLPPTGDCSGSPEAVDGGVLLNCSLTPRVDTASLGSTFTGRGPMMRLDVDFNLWRDKLILETGAALTVVRGKIDADFFGTNSVYLCTADVFDPDTGEGCHEGEIINSPWSQLSQVLTPPGEPPVQVSRFVAQESLSVGVSTQSESASSSVIDTFIGLRWAVLDWFEVKGGFRSSIYEDVGLDLIPVEVSQSVSGAIGIPKMTTKKTSVTYEGFYVGVTFRAF